MANRGIIVGVVAFVIAAVFLSAILTGGNGLSANMNSPSYIDGSNFASANYSNDTAASTVCNFSNASPGDRRSQWISGCLDT